MNDVSTDVDKPDIDSRTPLSPVKAPPASLIPSTPKASVSQAPFEPSAPRPAEGVPKGSRVSLPFPESGDRFLAPMDDGIIPHVQQMWSSFPLRVLILATTTLTAIETALPAPGALYALGYDVAGGLCTSVLLVLAICSQIPKKFIWRPRPWMAGRGKGFRKDKTSSFPSRAVVCAVTFAWLAFSSFAVEQSALNGSLPVNWSWFFVVSLGTLASVSRVCVGAHYPSDCLCGFILGVAIVKMGGKLETAWLGLGCRSLFSSIQASGDGIGAVIAPVSLAAPKFYVHVPASTMNSTISIASLPAFGGRVLWSRLLLSTCLSYLLVLASVQGFWVKCGYVYGLLFSMASFRYVFLAPGATGVALPGVLDHGSLGRHIKVSFLFLAWLALGMATRGKKGMFRLVAFTVIYFGTLGSVLWLRLG